jgi:histidine triad (HIT) family protein
VAYDRNNVFAKILRGELPSINVDENADVVAFMDIMPQADGHVLIVPKEPAATIFELSEEKSVACIKMTRRIALAVNAALACEGLMIAQVNGAAAGQTVPHVHFHVIPRSANSPLRAHGVSREEPAKLEHTASLIRAALKSLG